LIHYVVGDATHPTGEGNKIIAHIVNDIGAWGAGFVVALSRRWQAPEKMYRSWHASGEDFALGRIQTVRVEEDITVVNMAAQAGVGWRAGVPPIRYDALRSCLAELSLYAQENDASIHMPRIGCGLGGGDWRKVEPILQEELEGLEVYVYGLDGSRLSTPRTS
jgi:O-acetyl-ADP-ribose deacetylase (regulator of RNase III)